MKRILLFLLILTGGVPVLAQQGSLISNFDVENYPKVSFVWHEQNPNILPSSEFVLSENSATKKIQVERVKNKDIPKRQSLVVLWEDMASQGVHMHNFSQVVLMNFFESLLAMDEVYLATFNRHSPDESVLQPLTEGFSTNKEDLVTEVKYHQHSTRTYRDRPLESDVFPALNEALQMLQKREKKGYAKAIVVISSGMPLENSATNSVVSVQQLALKYHIPIYILQYASNHGPSSKLVGLANDTYGQNVTCVSLNYSTNIETGKKALRDFYSVIPKRYAGQDYCISYTTNCPRGHQEQMVKLKVAGIEYQQTFVTPSHTFGSWVKAHIILFVFFVILVLVVIGGMVFYIVYTKKQHEREIGNVIELQNQQMQKAESELLRQKSELNAYKMQQEEQAQREHRELERARLEELMHSKSLYPRLQYIANGETHSYEIHQVETILGRTPNKADVVITDDTVSRVHAKIVFDGNHFLISDCGSTNGTIVDGLPVIQQVVLQNHSLINLGSILINFNI